MPRRLVDSVTGIGSVHAGSHTLRATRYRLSFWVNDDLPSQTADAATIVDGHIDITGIGEAAVAPIVLAPRPAELDGEFIAG